MLVLDHVDVIELGLLIRLVRRHTTVGQFLLTVPALELLHHVFITVLGGFAMAL